MREDPLRDGSVALYADHDDNDSVTVEPIITAFTAMRGALFCVCGAVPTEPAYAFDWVTYMGIKNAGKRVKQFVACSSAVCTAIAQSAR